MVTAATNTSMSTYEISPVATLMEVELFKKLATKIGWEHVDGIMCSGGSNSNVVGGIPVL